MMEAGEHEQREKMDKRKIVSVIGVLFLLLTTKAYATYFISGYVVNASSGLPLSSATVMTNTSLSTTTNASGFYNFTGISNGSYILNASLSGYFTNSINVAIKGANVTNANISLSPMPASTYLISGYVLDSSTLQALIGANVTTSTSLQTTTDSTGFYLFSGLTNGSYRINASLFTYNSNSTNKTISRANIINANISLSPIPCTDCHYSFSYMNSSGRPDLYVNQTMNNQSVHSALNCKDCHTITTVHPPPKSGWKWCEDCHANQQNPQTNKSRHNIVSNAWNNLYNGISAVNITSCITCHNATLYNNSINTYGANKGIDCDYCHSFPDNAIG